MLVVRMKKKKRKVREEKNKNALKVCYNYWIAIFYLVIFLLF
jgi:hypothetical protein